MSLRMAELLAAVDNIAQDLRTGLDVEVQRSVEAEISDTEYASSHHEPTQSATEYPALPEAGKFARSPAQFTTAVEPDSGLEIVLVNETRRLVNDLTKPTALASLSQRLTAVLGTEITQTWSRFGGFKRFLEQVVPYSQLSGPAPGYIHPPHTPIPEGWTTEDTGTGAIPEVVRELRTYDKAMPLIGRERLDHVITAIGEVLATTTTHEIGGNATLAQIEEFAREARSIAESHDHLVVRPHATYVLQAIGKAGRLSSSLSDRDIRLLLREHIVVLAIAKGLIDSGDPKTARELNEWLGIDDR